MITASLDQIFDSIKEELRYGQYNAYTTHVTRAPGERHYRFEDGEIVVIMPQDAYNTLMEYMRERRG